METSTIKIETNIMERFRQIAGSNDTERLCQLMQYYKETERLTELVVNRIDIVIETMNKVVIAQADLSRRMDKVESAIEKATGKGY